MPLRGLPRVGAVGDTAHGVRQFLLTHLAGDQVRVRALVLRAEPAAAPGEPQRARRLLDEATAGPLSGPEPSDLATTLTRGADLGAELAADPTEAQGD